MGLLLWIPFVKGNYEYIGMLNPTISTLGTITYETGKIGQAVRIGTGTQITNGVSINTNLVEEFGDEYSCAVWIKPTGSHVHYEGAILSSGNWNNKKWAFGIGQNNTTIDPLGPGYNYKLACEIPVNEWTHLVSTVKNNVATVYKNGELIGTIDFGSLVLESDATNTTIGRESYANGYFSFNGCIQDMRIYNHCLSAEEAKKISQALVLHYSLSNRGFGGDNLIDGTPSAEIQYEYPGTSYNDKKTYRTNVIPTGSIYTLSFYAKSTVAGDIIRAHYYNPNTTTTVVSSQGLARTATDGRADFTLSTEWKRYWVKWGQNETTAVKTVIFPRMGSVQNYPDMSGTGTVSIRNVKFEEGNTATPWCPSVNDALYSSLQLGSTFEHDLSGYQYNGIKNNVANDTDSPVNNGCYIFDGNSSRIRTTANTSYIGTGDFTISAWVYLTSSGKTYQPIISNKATTAASVGCAIYFNHNQNKFLWSTADGSSATEIWTANTFADIYDKWTHVVMVRNSADQKVGYFYINGVRQELTSVPAIRNISTEHEFVIGELYTDSSNYRWTGKIADVRFYATALDADSIEELYETGVTG